MGETEQAQSGVLENHYPPCPTPWLFRQAINTFARNLNATTLSVHTGDYLVKSDQKKGRKPLKISKHMDRFHSSYLHRQQLFGIPYMVLHRTFHNMPFGRMASNRY
jgi:hypothetical protein